ncbi:MAG: hypothetical protein M5U17_16485, partial [Ignavibacterium sp.]|nr:hypothetical protein [Ignavibacterium sp.]
MKNLLHFCFFSFLCYNIAIAQTPTFADPPGPEHVLVVYKHPFDQNDSLGLVSQAVKNYYQERRGIPESNICRLDSLDTLVTVTYNDITHTIKLDQQGEIIRDTNNANS